MRAVFDQTLATPGVARVSLAQCCELDSQKYCQAAYEELAASGDFSTFKVHARRSNTTYPLGSIELNREIGSYLCERFPDKGVLMKGQDRTVHVYLIQNNAYVYVRTEEGRGRPSGRQRRQGHLADLQRHRLAGCVVEGHASAARS